MDVDVKKIEEDINRLNNMLLRCGSYTKYELICYSLEGLISVYETITGGGCFKINYNMYYENMRMVKQNRDIKKDYKKILEILPGYESLSKNVSDEFAKSNIEYYKKYFPKMSEKEFFDILRSFLASYSTDLEKEFELTLKRIYRSNLKEEDNNFIYYIPSLDQSHVFTEASNDVDGLLVTLHELGHSYMYKRFQTKSNCELYDSYYKEAFPMFLEMAFIDYLVKCNLRLKDTQTFLNDRLYFIRDTFQMFDLLKEEVTMYPKSVMIREIGDIKELMLYGGSGVISLEIAEQYEDNPHEIRKDISNFILAESNYNNKDTLGNLGMTFEDIIECRALKKRINSIKKID